MRWPWRRQHLGSLDKVTRVVRLTVSLATTPEFRDHAKVADGASELLASVFGADKTSTRMVSGVASLPAGVLSWWRSCWRSQIPKTASA